MIDILFNPKKAERHPIEIMFIAIFYSSVSLLVGAWIFPEYSSLIAVFFAVLSCFYLTQNIIKNEESKEGPFIQEKRLLKKHMKALKLFTFLFIGIVISFAFWTYALPTEMTSSMFSIQEKIFDGRKSEVTGNTIKLGSFEIIASNNLKVLAISFIISLIYGAGAMFVIVWNASLMGFVIGTIVKAKGLISIPAAFTKYFLHGIPEIFSYLTIILAGGITYMAIIKGDFSKKEKTKKTIIDILSLIIISVIIMILAALIEVFISPLI